MIKITVPFRTPSVNHLYGRKGNRCFIKREGKLLRERIQDQCVRQLSDIDLAPYRECQLMVVTRVHENWYTKEGKIKRVDVANREKFLIDSVFNTLYLDDKCIWTHIMIKEQFNSCMQHCCWTDIEISRLDNNGNVIL